MADVKDNVRSSDPEPMWEIESTSASIFKVLCKQRYTVVQTEDSKAKRFRNSLLAEALFLVFADGSREL